jgi:hypothetical protein
MTTHAFKFTPSYLFSHHIEEIHSTYTWVKTLKDLDHNVEATARLLEAREAHNEYACLNALFFAYKAVIQGRRSPRRRIHTHKIRDLLMYGISGLKSKASYSDQLERYEEVLPHFKDEARHFYLAQIDRYNGHLDDCILNAYPDRPEIVNFRPLTRYLNYAEEGATGEDERPSYTLKMCQGR